MSQKLKLLLIVTLFHSHVAFASDPDPVQDFCIAFKDSASGNPSCKNPSSVMVEDFTFSGIKFPGNYNQTGISIMLVNSNVFPGLNTHVICASRLQCWQRQCAALPSKSN
jgi:hypothetical protein